MLKFFIQVQQLQMLRFVFSQGTDILLLFLKHCFDLVGQEDILLLQVFILA